jgi:hypothetical protein
MNSFLCINDIKMEEETILVKPLKRSSKGRSKLKVIEPPKPSIDYEAIADKVIEKLTKVNLTVGAGVSKEHVIKTEIPRSEPPKPLIIEPKPVIKTTVQPVEEEHISLDRFGKFRSNELRRVSNGPPRR